MGTHSWTELFFLDEATGLARHRPCFFCRREARGAFRWKKSAMPKAHAIDAVLHGERLEGRRKRLHVSTYRRPTRPMTPWFSRTALRT